MTDELRRELINNAKEAIKNSYAPFTNFNVGAALLTKGGKIYRGCNIESKGFGSLVCAERNAIFNAMGNGERDFVAIAIVSSSNDETFPCGICRQFMYEFMSLDTEIILEDKDGVIKVYSVNEILPHGFKL